MFATTVRPATHTPGAATLSIRFFGRVADACGRSQPVAIPADGCSLAEVNRDDEVAFYSAFSGG